MQLSKILPETGCSIDCDGYVPLIGRSIGEYTFPPKYWRTGDFTKSLVEIGVDASTGALCKVTVTALNGLSSEPFPVVVDELITRGLPCATLDLWEHSVSRVDIEQTVEASIVGNRVILRFGPNTKLGKRGFRNGRLIFVVDDMDLLCGIEILECSNDELDELRHSVGVS